MKDGVNPSSAAFPSLDLCTFELLEGRQAGGGRQLCSSVNVSECERPAAAACPSLPAAAAYKSPPALYTPPPSISGGFHTLCSCIYLSLNPCSQEIDPSLAKDEAVFFVFFLILCVLCFTSPFSPPLDVNALIWPQHLTIRRLRPRRICGAQLYFVLIYYPVINLHCG